MVLVLILFCCNLCVRPYFVYQWDLSGMTSVHFLFISQFQVNESKKKSIHSYALIYGAGQFIWQFLPNNTKRFSLCFSLSFSVGHHFYFVSLLLWLLAQLLHLSLFKGVPYGVCSLFLLAMKFKWDRCITIDRFCLLPFCSHSVETLTILLRLLLLLWASSWFLLSNEIQKLLK